MQEITQQFWDHPRVCGEQLDVPKKDAENYGSSPRMRGTGLAAVATVIGVGIIPAYAGNRLSGKKSHKGVRDHPRVCGEQWVILLSRNTCSGSSPRMRGTAPAVCMATAAHGIIPAYAGNSRKVERSN